MPALIDQKRDLKIFFVQLFTFINKKHIETKSPFLSVSLPCQISFHFISGQTQFAEIKLKNCIEKGKVNQHTTTKWE